MRQAGGVHARIASLIALGLVAVTVLVFAPVGRDEFVNYDDNGYVYENAHVQHGLSWRAIQWAFTTRELGNWHPLTWLSYLADYQLYRLNAGGYHLTNLLLHVANTLLLFGVLRAMTGAVWRSAFVAALFAWHPLHVEAVAWISERKEMLCGFFWMLTLAAYLRYVRQPHWHRYLLVALCFALGLMAKPMMVTLPCVLVLLDVWPLRRTGTTSLTRLVAEKVPLLMLAAISSVITFVIQRANMPSLEQIAAPQRAANALVAYAAYLRKTIWPDDLAVVYLLPDAWPVARGGGDGGVGRGNGAGTLDLAAAAVSGGGMVVVSGHAGAGDRVGSSGRAIHVGPVHIPATGGHRDRAGLGRVRFGSELATRQGGAGGGRHIGAGHLCGCCRATTPALAEQCDTLRAGAGGDREQLACP